MHAPTSQFRIRLLSGLATAALLAAGAVQAQPGGGGGFGGGGFSGGSPGGGRGGPPAAVDGVTVTGTPSPYRATIDTQSYSIAQDLMTTSGSIADALKGVPSVEVDVEGNLSLRGDPNVTILIDGRPSGMFRGDGRGDALMNLPADQIERVEVMTNPSAAFSPDGGGGVINLVTKRQRGTGWSGSARGNYGTEGRYNGGVSAAYNDAKMTISGDANLRSNTSKSVSDDDRTQVSSSGVTTLRSQESVSVGTQDSRGARLSMDFDPDALNRFSAEVRYRGQSGSSTNAEHYENRNAGGLLTSMSDRLGETRSEGDNLEGSINYRRTIDEGHSITFDLSHERSDNQRDRQFVNLARFPAGADRFEVQTADTIENESRFRTDYVRPFMTDGTLKAGYDLRLDDNDYDNRGARGASLSLTLPDATLTNRFLYKQTIHAGYLTLEKPFGDFTVQGGLRLEDVETKIDQITAAISETNRYSDLYPSVHLSYRLSDSQNLRASYSHRVRRPSPNDLNPYPVYQDPFNFRAGNPKLEPQDTHSYEVSYQLRRNGAYYLATGFYRQNYNGVTDVVRDLGGGVLLSTRENLGESRSGGLELVANGKLFPALSYNINGTAAWNEIDASSLGFSDTRSAISYNGRANLNWQVTPDDVLQINGFAAGKRLTAQGYNSPFGMMNLGYRRKISDRLSLVVTAQDVLGTARRRTIVDTPLLKQEVDRRSNSRAVFVGFTYSFGGRGPQQQREGGFEFEGGDDAGGGGGMEGL
jgi:outer membrane receptor protein involved in Fe transport